MRIFLDDPNAIKQLVQTVSTTTVAPPSTNSILLPTYCASIPSPTTSSLLLSTPSLLSSAGLNGYHTNKLLTRDNSTDSQSNNLLNDSNSILNNETNPLPSSSPLNGLTNNSNKAKSRSKSSKLNNDKPLSSSSSSNHSRHSSTDPLLKPYELPKISLPSTKH